MHADHIRKVLHIILTSHDEALDAIRAANDAMRAITDGTRLALDAHDAAISKVIEANRAALRLLNRLMDEGVE